MASEAWRRLGEKLRLFWGGPQFVDERMLRISGIRAKTGFPVHLCVLGLALAYRIAVPTVPGVMWADYAAIFLLSWMVYCCTAAARYGWGRLVLGPIAVSAAIATAVGVQAHRTWFLSVPRAIGVAILAWPVSLALAGTTAGWLSGRLRRDEAWQYGQELAMYRGAMVLITGVMVWSVVRAVVWATDPSWIPMWLAGFMIPALLSGGIGYVTGNLDAEQIRTANRKPVKPWPGILFLVALIAGYHLRGGDLKKIVPAAIGIALYQIVRYCYQRNRGQVQSG